MDRRPDDQTREGRYEKFHSGNRNIAGRRFWRFHRNQWGSHRGTEKEQRLSSEDGEPSIPFLRDKTPTLRNQPDRAICLGLPYGNPDFVKEAERRKLTENKCKEIVGQ